MAAFKAHAGVIGNFVLHVAPTFQIFRAGQVHGGLFLFFWLNDFAPGMGRFQGRALFERQSVGGNVLRLKIRSQPELA